MSLWFTLMVNDHCIGGMEARRVSNTDQAVLQPDDVSEYEVQVITYDGDIARYQHGKVEHRYGDGPWVLLRNALDAALDQQPS